MGLTAGVSKCTPTEILPGKVSISISSGSNHLLVLTDMGTVYSMGSSDQGQLGRIVPSSSGESRYKIVMIK